MSQTNRQDRLDRLRGVGIEGSMSRGSDGVRERRGAQRELDFAKRFDPEYFTLDDEGRVTLKTTDLPRWRTVAPEFIMGVNVVGTSEAGSATPAGGYAFKYNGTSYNETYSMTSWWPIPEDCDRTRPLLFSFMSFHAQPFAASRTYRIDYSVVPYTQADGVTHNLPHAEKGSHQFQGDASTPTYQANLETEWELRPSLIFPQGAEALMFKLERETPTSGTQTDQSVMAGRVQLRYGVKAYHKHG